MACLVTPRIHPGAFPLHDRPELPPATREFYTHRAGKDQDVRGRLVDADSGGCHSLRVEAEDRSADPQIETAERQLPHPLGHTSPAASVDPEQPGQPVVPEDIRRLVNSGRPEDVPGR